MTSLMLLAAAGAAEIPAQVITTLITFTLVVITLTFLAWKPILAMLDERRNQIANRFDEIDRRMAESERLQKELNDRLAHIDDEARERLNQAIDEGRKVANEIIEKARAESEEIKEKAEANIRIEIDKARVELRQEVVEMTLAATGKLLQAELDDQRHRELVSGFITELEKRPAS